MLVKGLVFRANCLQLRGQGYRGLVLQKNIGCNIILFLFCFGFPSFFQEQVTSAVALAIEQQMQKVLEETQLDMNEFDNLLQPIIDTCTKDAISVSDLNLNS